MKQNMLKQAAIYHKERRRKAKRHKIFSILAAIVVFCTTVILIMPAATMENTLKCGLEEHVHTEECQSAEAEALVCGLEESEGVGHIHDDACYEAVLAAELICTEEDEDHIHSDECYETVTASKLVCTEEEDWTEGHTHSDECYGKTQPAYVCGLEEHIHTDECRQAENEVGEAAEPVEEDNFLQDEDGSLILDENGEPVPADEDVLPILEDEENGNDGNDGNDEFLRDEEGNLILDENGEPVLVDEEGDPISEDEEPESCEFLRDEDGNLVLDENGDPILVDDGAEAEELAEAEEIVYTLNGRYYQTVFHVNYYGELLADDEIAFTAATNEDMESDRDWEYLSLASDSKIIPMGRTEFALTLNGETVDRSEYTVSVEIIPSYESVAFLAVNQGDDTMMLNLTDEEDAAEEPEVMAGFALFELMDGELAGMGYTTVDVESLDLDSYMADAYDEEGNPAYDEAYTVEAEVSGEDFMITAGVDENPSETLEDAVNPTFTVQYYLYEWNGKQMYEDETRLMYTTGDPDVVDSATNPAQYDRVANSAILFGKDPQYTLTHIDVMKSATEGGEVREYKEGVTKFTNNPDAVDENTILIQDGTILRYLYEPTTDTVQSVGATFYDYWSTKWSNGYISGINKPEHYSNDGGKAKLRFVRDNGNFNCDDEAIVVDGVTYRINYWAGDYEFKNSAHPGIVAKRLGNDGGLVWSDQVDAPDLFGATPLDGKREYDGYTLNFERTGDAYVLQSVQTPKGNTVTAGSNFWVMTDCETGGNAPGGYWYGMHYKVEFTVEKGYRLPMTYEFIGDDDMWAYLTPVGADGKPNYSESELIVDVGGIHGAATGSVDLLDKIQNSFGVDETSKTYQIDVFYLERGAGECNCNMTLRLPNMTMIDTSTGTLNESLVIEKKLNGDAANGMKNTEFTFKVKVEDGTSNYVTYQKVSASGAAIGSRKQFACGSEETFVLKGGEHIIIYNLTKYANFTVTETDARGADATSVIGSNKEGAITSKQGDEISGKVSGRTTVTFTNTFNKKELHLYKVSGTIGENTMFTCGDLGSGYLNGAEFTLYNSEGKLVAANLKPNKQATAMTPATATLTIGETYYLVEGVAPNGYNRLAEAVYFTVNEDGTVTVWTESTVDQKQTGSITDDVFALTIYNYGGYVLPSTGGPGATLYTLGGVLFMLAAAFLMYKNLRKRGCAVD